MIVAEHQIKFLIAGFGDLGSVLAQTCLATPAWQQARLLAIKRTPPTQLDQPHVNWVKADLSNPDSVLAVATQLRGITHVVYCAAPNERSEAAYRSTYIHGLQNLVAALKSLAHDKPGATELSLPQLLFVSSTAVYDNQAQGKLDESSATEPRSFNGKVLLEAENWLLAKWPDPLILRLSGIYGPTKRSLLRSIAAGTTVVPESLDFIANRIHAEDAARAILHLFEHKLSGIYIGSDSHPIPIKSLYQRLAQMLGAPEPKTGPPSPMMGKKRLSNQKLLSTGFDLRWPDSLKGYQALMDKPVKR